MKKQKKEENNALENYGSVDRSESSYHSWQNPKTIYNRNQLELTFSSKSSESFDSSSNFTCDANFVQNPNLRHSKSIFSKENQGKLVPIFYSPKAKLTRIKKNFDQVLENLEKDKRSYLSVTDFSTKFNNQYFTVVKSKQKNISNLSVGDDNTENDIPDEISDSNNPKSNLRSYQPVKNNFSSKKLDDKKNESFDDFSDKFISQEPRIKNLTRKYQIPKFSKKLENLFPNKEKTPRLQGYWSPSKPKRFEKKFSNKSRFNFKVKFESKKSFESGGVSNKFGGRNERGLQLSRTKTKINFISRMKLKSEATKKWEELSIKPRRRKKKKKKKNNVKKTEDFIQFFNSRKSRMTGLARQATSITQKTFYLEDQLNKPNLGKLRLYLRENYLKSDWMTRNRFWGAACQKSTVPTFTCCGVKKNPYDKAGSGLNLFFSFLKSSIILFIFYFLITLPIQTTNVVLYGKSKHPNLKYEGKGGLMSTITSVLTSTTMAASASFNQVIYEYSFRNNQTMLVSCEYGMVTIEPDWTKFGYVSKKKSLEQLSFSIDDTCTNYTNVMMSMQDCIGKNHCKVSFDLGWINSDPYCLERRKEKRGVLAVNCKHVIMKVFDQGYRSLIKIYMYDLGFCFCVPLALFYYIVWLVYNKKKILEGYKCVYYSPSDFTLQLKNIPRMTEKKAISQTKEQDSPLAVCPIMDIKVAQPHIVYKRSLQLVKLESKRQKLLAKLKSAWNTDLLPTSTIKLGSILDEFKNIIFNNIIDKDDPLRIKDAKICYKIVKKLITMHEKIKNYEREIDGFKEKKRDIDSMFVTFRYRSDKKIFKTMFPTSRTQSFFGCYKKIQLEAEEEEKLPGLSRKTSKKIIKKDITAIDPVDPLNINWSHLDRSNLSKCRRRTCSWILYLAFYAFPIYTFLFFKNQKLLNQSFTPNCTAFSSVLSKSEIFEMVDEWEPTSDALKCICISRKELISEKILENYGQPLDLCSTVKTESSTLTTIKIVEVVVISAISIIFDFAFDWLAQLEGYSDYNKRQSSVLIKLFFWKYSISSLFPVLANTDIFDNVLIGKQDLKAFDDFTPVWYVEVGSGLILSMYIRIFIIIGDFIFRYYWPRIFQCCDRGGVNKPLANDLDYAPQNFFGKRKLKIKEKALTKKRTHREYVGVYKNPHFEIERSYAEILNTIFFSFTYWIMLPHIFLPSILVLSTIYFKDKILTLTTHRNKYRLDETLYQNSLVIIKFAPVVIISIVIWIFGNEVFISTNNYVDDVLIKSYKNSYVNKFNQKIYEGISSNFNFPLSVKSRFRYDQQAGHRMVQSTYSYSFYLALVGYGTCLITHFLYRFIRNYYRRNFLFQKRKRKNELVYRMFYIFGKNSEHSFDYQHINDEIRLHNRNLFSKYNNETCNEMVKLRASKIMELYDKLNSIKKIEKQKEFLKKNLWRYQFISLPSYDFRLNPRYKSYYLHSQYTVYNDYISRRKKSFEENKKKKLTLIKVRDGFVNDFYKRFEEEAEKAFEEEEKISGIDGEE